MLIAVKVFIILLYVFMVSFLLILNVYRFIDFILYILINCIYINYNFNYFITQNSTKLKCKLLLWKLAEMKYV